ncbi:C-type lectin lectoxin-Enh2-like, partial [Anoplopoma fimbria]|uniref:C-type lectin lectoxin-Enh2-like n=1 Tax=Anoplopoma fimbria TaxID=229290 RepID=UPI0023EBBADB
HDDHQVKLQRGNCLMFWYDFNRRCYKYDATEMTWRWMWSDGSAVNFYFWYGREPNKSAGSEHCVHKNYDPEFKWKASSVLGND